MPFKGVSVTPTACGTRFIRHATVSTVNAAYYATQAYDQSSSLEVLDSASVALHALNGRGWFPSNYLPGHTHNQSINVAPVAMRLKTLIPAIH